LFGGPRTETKFVKWSASQKRLRTAGLDNITKDFKAQAKAKEINNMLPLTPEMVSILNELPEKSAKALTSFEDQ